MPLLMVHAVLSLTVKLWPCCMTRVYADTKALASKFSQKNVSLYTSIYGSNKW